MNLQIADGLVLRSLGSNDTAALAQYFEGLSRETRRRFGPHPLTAEAAQHLCATVDSATWRLVVERAGAIIAYFILEPAVSEEESGRYRRYGVDLTSGEDYRFAPSVADAYQNTGVASLAMPHVVSLARAAGGRSLVLMGGTQATNARAIAFYKKVGFRWLGDFETDVSNHDMQLVL